MVKKQKKIVKKLKKINRNGKKKKNLNVTLMDKKQQKLGGNRTQSENSKNNPYVEKND